MTNRSLSKGRGENFDRLLRQEELILDVTERLIEALEEQGVTRAELARRLARTPGFVSQLFAGGRNLTLRTIADIAGALSRRPSLRLSPEWRSVVHAQPASVSAGWTAGIASNPGSQWKTAVFTKRRLSGPEGESSRVPTLTPLTSVEVAA